MMVPSRGQTDQLLSRDIAQGLSRVPGKGLSEATLPLDRAVANHLLVSDGYAKASSNGSVAEMPQADAVAGEQAKDDASLYYRVYGNGAQKVVMVMGLSASHAGWEYLLPFLAGNQSRYQVAVFDNRGIGNSLCPNKTEDYSMEIFAADTIAVADALGWDQFHLVGFSMGGMICQTVAALYPQRLLSLALLATTARRSIQERIPPVSELPSLLNWVLARSEEEKAEADLRMHFDDEYLQREFVDGATIRDFWLRVYLEDRAAAEKTQGQAWCGFTGQLSALTNFGLTTERIATIRKSLRVPVLIMSGKKDRIVHPESGRLLHNYLTRGVIGNAPPLSGERCRLVRLDAGHFLPIQKRREVASSLLSLWHEACPDEEGKGVGEEGLRADVKPLRLADAIGVLSRLTSQSGARIAKFANRAPSMLTSLSVLAKKASQRVSQDPTRCVASTLCRKRSSLHPETGTFGLHTHCAWIAFVPMPLY